MMMKTKDFIFCMMDGTTRKSERNKILVNQIRKLSTHFVAAPFSAKSVSVWGANPFFYIVFTFIFFLFHLHYVAIVQEI